MGTPSCNCPNYDLEEEGMNGSTFQIILALAMLTATVMMIVTYHAFRRAGSARRIARMMKRLGLDPTIMKRGEAQSMAVAEEVWDRCRKCPVEGHCERWLRGDVSGGHTFCPNAGTFHLLSGS